MNYIHLISVYIVSVHKSVFLFRNFQDFVLCIKCLKVFLSH